MRGSGLNYAIFKAGVIYGRGDHMLDHLSHALYTFPIFGLVGRKERQIRPVAVEDLVTVIIASFGDARLANETLGITGPEDSARLSAGWERPSGNIRSICQRRLRRKKLSPGSRSEP